MDLYNLVMKISQKDGKAFEREGFAGNFYLENMDEGFNAIFVDCFTGHPAKKIEGMTRCYFVIDGSGTFTINGEVMPAESHDFFIIKSGETYEYTGAMHLFEFNVPSEK